MNKYDDRALQQLFIDLDEKNRTKALKAAFRREAVRVRRVAVDNLRSKKINTSTGLEKGIRAVVFKRKAGFKVTIGTKRAGKNGKGEKGFHKNRFGKRKPVLIWAEEGTEKRKTNKRYTLRGIKKGHSTGRMTSYGFMRKTRNEVGQDVSNTLRKEVQNSIIKTAKKYGCK